MVSYRPNSKPSRQNHYPHSTSQLRTIPSFFPLISLLRNSGSTVNERIGTQLIGMGRRKHQRLDGDGNDFGDTQAFADIDVIQVADFDAVDSDDIPRHMALIFENAAERLGDVEVQGQIEWTFWIIGVFENLRHTFGNSPDGLIIRHTAHGQRQSQAGCETGQIELTQRLL